MIASLSYLFVITLQPHGVAGASTSVLDAPVPNEYFFKDQPEGEYTLEIVNDLGCDFTQKITVECDCPVPEFEIVLPSCHIG